MYVYCADTYCESCGEKIRAELAAAGQAPADPSDEGTYDSDDYPKGPCAEEPTDGPDHCASGDECLEPVDLFPYWHGPLELHGAEATHIGALLSDGLTDEGVSYLREMLAETARTPYQDALHAYWREVFADELEGVEA